MARSRPRPPRPPQPPERRNDSQPLWAGRPLRSPPSRALRRRVEHPCLNPPRLPAPRERLNHAPHRRVVRSLPSPPDSASLRRMERSRPTPLRPPSPPQCPTHAPRRRVMRPPPYPSPHHAAHQRPYKNHTPNMRDTTLGIEGILSAKPEYHGAWACFGAAPLISGHHAPLHVVCGLVLCLC